MFIVVLKPTLNKVSCILNLVFGIWRRTSRLTHVCLFRTQDSSISFIQIHLLQIQDIIQASKHMIFSLNFTLQGVYNKACLLAIRITYCFQDAIAVFHLYVCCFVCLLFCCMRIFVCLGLVVARWPPCWEKAGHLAHHAYCPWIWKR